MSCLSKMLSTCDTPLSKMLLHIPNAQNPYRSHAVKKNELVHCPTSIPSALYCNVKAYAITEHYNTQPFPSRLSITFTAKLSSSAVGFVNV